MISYAEAGATASLKYYNFYEKIRLLKLIIPQIKHDHYDHQEGAIR